jgi:hypothetical protein
VIQMCDALSRNVPKLPHGVEILVANCLAHGRRPFMEVVQNFPRSADMCWRCWVRYTGTMPKRAMAS